MLALIFTNEVFVISKLTLAKQLFRLRISSRQNQLELSFKQKMQEMSIFRRWKSTIHESQIFETKALAQITFRSQMMNLDRIIDMKLSIILYIFRRNNEKALDNNNKWHVHLSFQLLLTSV